MEKEKLLLFLSYSRSNQEYIEKIAKDIKKLEHNIWFDNQISGGQRWWNQILAQIRKADILVFILSQESLHSTACQCEYDYAAALGKPILPVLIDNKVSVNTLPDPLTQIPLVEYRVRNADSIIELATSLFTIDISKDLPDPLPDPPNVPGTYLGTIIEKLEVEKTLSINEQSALWIQLKEYYERTSSKSDAIISIKKLQSRSDLLASIDREISRFLLKFDNQKANPPAPR